MYKSIHRIKKQWREIKETIESRDDIIPFNYSKNLRIKYHDEVFPVKSRREFYQKLTELMGKYGQDAEFKIDYLLNYTQLVDQTEQKYKKLMNP